MRSPRILLVDDEYVTLAMLQDLLEAQGYKVIIANRAADGIREAIYGNPDLIMLDIILPDQDGFSVLTQLRKNERTRDIPVVLLSALSSPQGLDIAEAAAFVRKPIVADEILSVVSRILGTAPEVPAS